MKRYLLDTCTLIWYIEGDRRVKDIVYDIEYYQGDFAVSIESLKELTYLLQSGKGKLDINYTKLMQLLNRGNIAILPFTEHDLKTLFELPFFKEHTDPVDRHIIATSIAGKHTLISGDSRFFIYKEAGLNYLKI